MKNIQLWHDMKEYFEHNGVKEWQSDNTSYEEMYNEEYCDWLSHFYYCTFNEPCDLEYEDIDELCDKVWKAQSRIEEDLRRRFNELEE